MLDGINHITLAVSDLDRSFEFYTSALGMKPEVKWDSGAYLSAGDLWFYISLDTVSPAKDYSLVCFSVAASEFEERTGLITARLIRQR